jgi:hypothetical protein
MAICMIATGEASASTPSHPNAVEPVATTRASTPNTA